MRIALVAVKAGSTLVLLLVFARIVQIYGDAEVRQDYRSYESRLVSVTGTRGRIVDRKGKLLATNERTYEITVNLVETSDTTRELLKTRFGEQFPDVRGRGQVTAVVLPETMREARALEGIRGVTVRAKDVRVRPFGAAAGPAIGYKGDNGGRGLEYLLNGVLEGRPGLLPATSRKHGKTSFLGGIPPEFSGDDVVLTLDIDVQSIAEEALGRAVRDTNAIGGAALVLDLREGEYLALASEPRYDPNAPEKAEYEFQETGERVRKAYEPGGEPWDWKPLQWGFEPGSTLKPVVVAIALETGTVNPAEFEYTCTGKRRVADRTIKEFNNEVHGHIDLRHLIVESCNLAASVVGESLTKEVWKQWAPKLGIAREATEVNRRRINLYSIAERVPRLRENWTNVDRANRGFGQGIEVTPVQLARMYTPFALRGVELKPCWIREVRTSSGRARWRCRPQKKTVFSAETADWIRQSLEAVVNEGTGVAAALPGVRVAGKTGTAQKAVPVDAEKRTWVYSREKLVTSFIGFFPADKPRYLIGVFLNEPKGHLASGGKFAAPAFRRMAYKLGWRDGIVGSEGEV
jgi:cell division protein FtsI/penicillin-binding protein 2